MNNSLMFYLFAAIILVSSVLTVTSRKILRSAVFLLFVLIATSGLYFMLNFTFLAAVQLTLYAGGIVVLIIFSILLTSHIGYKFPLIEWKKAIFSVMVAGTGAALSLITLLSYDFNPVPSEAVELPANEIGRSLMNYGDNGFVLPFEVISILLLAAMAAAIVIAKKPKDSQ